MNAIMAGYTTNLGVTWQQMQYAANVGEAPPDNGRQPPSSAPPRGDSVTISNEARAMYAAAFRGDGSVEGAGGNPGGGGTRGAGAPPAGMMEAGGAPGGRGPAGAGAARGGGGQAAGATRGGASGASGADAAGNDEAAIAELEEKIRILKAEISELMMSAGNDEESKRLLASKQLELQTLENQLARLESNAAAMTL